MQYGLWQDNYTETTEIWFWSVFTAVLLSIHIMSKLVTVSVSLLTLNLTAPTPRFASLAGFSFRINFVTFSSGICGGPIVCRSSRSVPAANQSPSDNPVNEGENRKQTDPFGLPNIYITHLPWLIWLVSAGLFARLLMRDKWPGWFSADPLIMYLNYTLFALSACVTKWRSQRA